MRVLFLHHQQRRHYRDEPGYNELFLPLCQSPRLTDVREFVYQPILRELFRYEQRLLDRATLTEMKLVEAVGRANQAFYPTLRALVDVNQPDLVIYSPSFLHESIYPQIFKALKVEFPRLRLFTQLWDYDENNPLMLLFERQLIEVSDLISVADSIGRVERMHRREGIYDGLVNAEAVAWLPTRPNPHVFRPRDVPTSIDVALFGSSEAFRKDVIAALAQRYGSRFRHIGGYRPEDKFVTYEEYADAICRSRIIVNSQTRKDGQQIKGRTREVLACGGFLIDQRNEETPRFFEGSGVDLWSDFDELYALIDRYLEDEEGRRRKAAAAHAWYLERYSAATYFDEILALLERRGRQPAAAIRASDRSA